MDAHVLTEPGIHFIAVTALLISACAAEAQTAMNPQSNDQPGFQVIGIEARTNNSQEATGGGAIPKQWQRLFMENLLGQIPDRLDQSIIAVYTNYASDANGDYTYILGSGR